MITHFVSAPGIELLASQHFPYQSIIVLEQNNRIVFAVPFLDIKQRTLMLMCSVGGSKINVQIRLAKKNLFNS